MYTEDIEDQEAVPERRSSGASVRHLATVLCFLGMLGAVVMGGLVIRWTEEPFLGLLAGVAAGYLTWAVTRVLRSFGEMAEDAAATRKAVEQLLAIRAEEHAWALAERRTADHRAEPDDSAKYPAG